MIKLEKDGIESAQAKKVTAIEMMVQTLKDASKHHKMMEKALRTGRSISSMVEESSICQIIMVVDRFNGWLIALKTGKKLQNMHKTLEQLADDHMCRISCLITFNHKIIMITYKKFDDKIYFITIFNPSSFQESGYRGSHYLITDNWNNATFYVDDLLQKVNDITLHYFKLNKSLSKKTKHLLSRENIAANVHTAASNKFDIKV